MAGLLADPKFSEIFEPWRGLRVGLVVVGGNVGDCMIHLATLSLARRFEVDMQLWAGTADYDELAICGGGNMGENSPWADSRSTKIRALQTGLPVTCLPQSFNGQEPGIEAYVRVFVREEPSLQSCPPGHLAPDLALAYEPSTPFPPAVHSRIVALKQNAEGLWIGQGDGDPIKEIPGTAAPFGEWSANVERYIARAAQYENIATDRVHFATAGLLAGRCVWLLPNTYHKNRGMWQTSLAEFGCQWLDSPEQFTAGRTC